MADERVSEHIEALVKEEHELLDRGGTEHGLDEAGHEVVRVDIMLANAHGATEPPTGTLPLDVRDAAADPAWRDALSGVDAVCHQAAVVGAGTMGGEIAQAIASSDIPVVLKDIDQKFVDHGLEKAREVTKGQLDGLVEKLVT